MGPSPPPPPHQGLCFRCPWLLWWVGGREPSTRELKTWRLVDGMEEGGLEASGLRFFLRFGPGKQLLGVALSSGFPGWTGTGQGAAAIAEDGGESVPAAVASAVALAAAVSVCLAASGQRPRRPRLAAVVAGPSYGTRPRRAMSAPDDGLRVLSYKDEESPEHVIHGASIGAGDDDDDDEPVIVARVDTARSDVAGADADGQPEEERRRERDRLRELWLSLVEREQRLELRRQELEGLRLQEAAAREVENRARAAATEARLLELKVSSLQEENARLRARVEELDDARADIARAKEKLRATEARVRAEQEETIALRARVAELKRSAEERASKLAAEAAALREANAALEEENLELALRLQDAEQQPATSVHVAIEQESLAEETKQLRETNETLTRQIEQLHSDHCAHVEELVYLKWVNACLRHELSEHGLHPPCSEHQDHDGSAIVADGGMSAMELSKSMSFRSSERAKQLMLRYGHPGLDPALFSPLHESMDGDELTARARTYNEPARSPAGTSVTTTTAPAPGKRAGPRKLKFLGNIKKLLPGGGGGKRSHSSHGGGGSETSSRLAPAPMPSDEYLEKAMRWLSTHDVLDFDHSYETTPLSSCDRTPPSSATTVTTRGLVMQDDVDSEPAASLARSKSDGGKSCRREASRYHSPRPDHPTADETGVAPRKWERRRRSEELRSPGAARA